MTEAKAIEETTVTGGPTKRSARSMFARLEVDTRLLGMIAALAILWIAFNFLSDGLFLSPRNLWNLSVQSAAVAIMTSGMVLIIVSRNIDLSIGSILVFAAMIMGLLQTEWIPTILGPGFDRSFLWIVVVLVGIAVGALIGGVHGFLVAFIGIPSFIVTLGGLLIWRGAAFQLARGRTIAPLDETFQLLGGGPKGSLGETLSWLVAGSRSSPSSTASSPVGVADAGTAFHSARCGRTSRSGSSAASPSPVRCGSPTATPGHLRWRSRTRSSTGSRSRRVAC